MEKQNNWHDKVSFAIFLVFIGVLFLLGNFGYISFGNIFTFFFRFWPLFIIIWGIKLVIGAIPYGKIINIVVDVLVNIAIILGLVFFNDVNLNTFNINNVVSDYSYSIDSSDKVATREYEFQIGASVFEMNDTSTKALEISGKEVVGSPKLDYSYDGTDLKSKFVSDTSVGTKFWWVDNNQRFDISLGQNDKPLDLILKIGAGDGNIVLKNTVLNSLDVNVGASKLDMDIRSLPSTSAFNVGAGDVTLNISNQESVSLVYSVGAGQVLVQDNLRSMSKSVGGLASKGTLKIGKLGEVKQEKVLDIEVGAGNVTIILN